MRQDEHLSALQPGARLHLYTIGAILGAGGFGITYRAREDITNREVAIKEFLPSAFAVRDRNGSTVRPLSEGAAKDFEWGLERFRQEAKLLIDLRHPNIVPVLAYFESNATGYLVMEFQEGSSLGQLLKTKSLSETETLGIVVPLLDGVEEVHRHKFLHRDIKPENIFVRRDGTPVLLDFGAARQALGEHSKSFTTLLTEGYAPFEQYAGTGNQGPWSDIYALSAVMFRCLMGKPPAEAPRRAAAKLGGSPDPMAPEFVALRTRASSDLAFAIEAGMRVVEHERPQTIAAFRDLILAPASAGMRAVALSASSPTTGTPAAGTPATGMLATGMPSPTLIPDMAQLAAALNPPSWSRPERRKPRHVARYAAIGVFVVAAASAAAYIGDQRSWLPEAFKRAGPDTAPVKPVAPAKAEEPKRPADDAQRRAEEERRRAEDELKRAEEERRNKAMGDHQRRQLEQTEGERRKYLDAQKAAEAERKRQEEQKAKTEAERKAAEERARADEERKRSEDERKRAEEAARKRQDDENARGGERTRRSEERRRADDERKRADDERKRIDDERRRAEDAARKRQDDENARGGAERKATEERARADDERKRAEDERKRVEDAARKRQDDENARGNAERTRRDGFPPPPPSPPPSARRGEPSPPAPGEGRDMRRQPPDVPPARGRVPPDSQQPSNDQ